jgi:hypothetical protein
MANEENNENKKDYSIDEFHKIAEHIEKSQSAFIITDYKKSDEEEHEVLMTAKGKRDDVIVMIVESMLKHPQIADIVQSSFLSYVDTIEKRKRGN